MAADSDLTSDGDADMRDAQPHSRETQCFLPTSHSGISLPHDVDSSQVKAMWAQLPLKHRSSKSVLTRQYRAQFTQWRFQLRQQHSLLFYGFGSKRELLEQFASETLTDGGVLVINGQRPALTSKAVLAAVAGALTHRSFRSSNQLEALAAIESEPAVRHLYVLLHNIDGPGLRSPEEQTWLSRVAACRNVHLLASVDHTNAALLWHQRASARFRWMWHNVTNYAPYEQETGSCQAVLTGCQQSVVQRGAGMVLHSLTHTARTVFRLLAQRQLDEPASPGTSFGQLYKLCRELFVLSTEHALRSHLAEFLDHELVKTRLGAGGGTVMVIPMEQDALRSLLAQLNDPHAT